MAANLDLLVPVKPLALAKSRLFGVAGAGQRDGRADLVLAFAVDTVTAALATPGVRRAIAVTADPVVTAEVRAAGGEVLPDEPSAGLNPALRAAAERLRAADQTGRIGALQADLPALRPNELADALRGAGDRRAFCPDRQGTGTTLLLAAPGDVLAPRFGVGSAAAHAASGAVELSGPWPSLRCDVDTESDLAHAVTLGLGRRTTAALAGDGRWQLDGNAQPCGHRAP